MNYFIKDLNFNNCIRFRIGQTEILLDRFFKDYSSNWGTDNVILYNKDRYFSLGYIDEKNKLAEDIENFGYNIIPLEKHIHELIYEKIIAEMFNYIEEVKDEELYATDMFPIFSWFSSLGKSPLKEIQEQIEFQTYFDKLANDEIIIKEWNDKGYTHHELKYNIVFDSFYIDDDVCNKEKEQKMIFDMFCSDTLKKAYVLYHRYINNKLFGEDLAYKEMADLNKWLEDNNAKTVTVVYNDKNGVEQEKKIAVNVNFMFSYLRREYSREMMSFYGVDDINSITQIKGFKYNRDFHPFNTENLIYKKG